jgi:hypothetical protein
MPEDLPEVSRFEIINCIFEQKVKGMFMQDVWHT